MGSTHHLELLQKVAKWLEKEKNEEDTKYSSPPIWCSLRMRRNATAVWTKLQFNIKNKNIIIYTNTASVTAPVLVELNDCETEFGRLSGGIESMEIDERNESRSDDNDDSGTEYTSRDKKTAVP